MEEYSDTRHSEKHAYSVHHHRNYRNVSVVESLNSIHSIGSYRSDDDRKSAVISHIVHFQPAKKGADYAVPWFVASRPAPWLYSGGKNEHVEENI
jgi:hypothetical protein